MAEIVDWQQPPRRRPACFSLGSPSLRGPFQQPDGVILLRRRPVVRLARIRRCFPQDDRPSVGRASRHFWRHISFSVRLVPGAARTYRSDLPDDHPDDHRHATPETTSRAHSAPRSVLAASLVIAVIDRLQRHDGMADVRTLLAMRRAQPGAVWTRSSANPSTSIYSLFPPGSSSWAGSCASRASVRDRCLSLFSLLAALGCVSGRRSRYISHVVARVLHCVCFLLADPRDAHVYCPVRTLVRRAYDFQWRDLHGCPRRSTRHARGLCCARSRSR